MSGVEHIGALGEGAAELYGRYIPRKKAAAGTAARALVCEDDPELLRRYLEQTARRVVYQHLSVLLQKSNARILTERIDALARLAATGSSRAADARLRLSSSSQRRANSLLPLTSSGPGH